MGKTSDSPGRSWAANSRVVKWTCFGKQNWCCGMNQTRGYGARGDAHQNPQKVLVDTDSRTVAMEVGIR